MGEESQSQRQPEPERQNTAIDPRRTVAVIFLILVAVTLLSGTYAILLFSAKKGEKTNLSSAVSQKPPAASPTLASRLQPIEGEIPLPLVNKLANNIIYANEGEIIMTDGKTRKSLINIDGIIHDIAVSPDGQKISYTYSSKDSFGNSGPFSYPVTGLKIFNLNNGLSRELVPLADQTVRYPFWSRDGRYLTVWLNDGDSSRIINVANGAIVLAVAAENKTRAVSPIIFTPFQENRIAYIQDGQLIEADINGQNKSAMLKNLEATRWVHEGPPLPNPPIYSNDGNYVAIYFENGDLAILDKKNNKTKILSRGYKSEFFGENLPSGFIVGFNKQNNFVYDEVGEEGYQLGSAPPVYIYFPQESKISNLPISSSADLSSMMFSPDLEKLITHSSYTGQGLNIHSSVNGELLNDCSKVDFRYSFYNWGGGPDYSSGLKVWSTDGKYLVSEGGAELRVMNIETCEVSIISPERFSFATWVPSSSSQ